MFYRDAGRSALDGAGHDTSVEILLEEGIHDDQRQAGNDNGGIFEQLGQLARSAVLWMSAIMPDSGWLWIRMERQHQLQGLLGGVVQVDHGVKVAVPHGDELPQGQHRTRGIQMGTRIWKKKVISLAPSTSEASRSSRGTPW